MTTRATLKLSKDLFSGIYFYGKDENKLVISVNKLVDSISLETHTEDNGSFELQDISLTGLGGINIDNLAFKAKPREIKRATKKQDKNKGKKLFQNIAKLTIKAIGAFRLTSRTKSQLHLAFKETTFVSSIILDTTPSHISMTAHKNLSIQTICGGVRTILYSTNSDNNYLRALDRSLRVFNIKTEKKDEYFSIRETLELSIMNKIRANSIDSIDNLFLHQCLPLLETEPILNDFHVLALATIIFKINLSHKWRPIKLYKLYSNLLWHDEIIQKVMSKYNEIHEIVYQQKANFFLSKHNMQMSNLLRKKNKYLDAMQLVIGHAKEIEIEIIICYGTLLGAVRNQSFLTHDDDVDLLVLYKNAKSRDEAIEQENVLCKHLEEKNIKVRRKPKGIGFWATNPKSKIQLDMFACWESEEGQTMLMMEHLDYRTVPTNILRPPSQVHLHGKDFPAPSNPKAFLQERYGSTWEKPDPYHEFPWPVQMD